MPAISLLLTITAFVSCYDQIIVIYERKYTGAGFKFIAYFNGIRVVLRP